MHATWARKVMRFRDFPPKCSDSRFSSDEKRTYDFCFISTWCAGNISKKYEITNEYSVELFLHTYLVVKKAARQHKRLRGELVSFQAHFKFRHNYGPVFTFFCSASRATTSLMLFWPTNVSLQHAAVSIPTSLTTYNYTSTYINQLWRQPFSDCL